MFIGHFVDDCITAYFGVGGEAHFADVIAELKEFCDLKVSDQFTKMLGFGIEVIPGEGILFHAKQYVRDLLDQHGIRVGEDVVDTPELSGETTGTCEDESLLSRDDMKAYQSIAHVYHVWLQARHCSCRWPSGQVDE